MRDIDNKLTHEKSGLSYTLTLILSSTICFYAAGYTQFSPIYLIYLMTMPVIIIYASNYIDHIYFPKDSRILFALLVYVVIIMLSLQTNSITSGEFINLFLSIYSYIFIRFATKRISDYKYKKIIKTLIRITLFLLAADTVYRLVHPSFSIRTDYLESNYFYYYKSNSVMFADSNSTGLVCLILYFFLKQLEYIGFLEKKKNWKYESILVVLLILSFSRAAYIAFIAGLLYKKLKMNYNKARKSTILTSFFILPILLFIGATLLYRLYKVDLSFQSKFLILQNAAVVFSRFDIKSKLFGIGFKSWLDVLGIYSHNIFITYILFTGLIGFAIFAIYLIYSLRYLDIILIPFIVVSLSFFSYLGMPFLFVPLAISYNIYDNYHNKNNLRRL